MTLALVLPQANTSCIAGLDPRWKLAALVSAALVLAWLQHPWTALLSFVGATFLACLAKLPARWYWSRLGIVGLFLLFFVIWIPFLDADGPFLAVGSLTLSIPGLERAATLLLRAGTLVGLVLVLVGSAPLPDTLKAAHALHAPGLLVQLTLLSYRYVFLLAEEFQRLRTALRVRGFRNRFNLHSYRTIGQVTGTLLVRGHERAERVDQAMRSRGFDGRFRSLHFFQTTWREVVFFVLVVGFSVGMLMVDRIMGNA